MSWKTFLQIVLLILIASLVMPAAKKAMFGKGYCMSKMMKQKCYLQKNK